MDKMVRMIDCGLCSELFCSVADQDAFWDFFNNLPASSYIISADRVSDGFFKVRVFCSSDHIQELEKYFVERGVLHG